MKYRYLTRAAAAGLVLFFGARAFAQPPITDGVYHPPATAADSAIEAQTTAVASTLRCPVCQGESIQDSPSELSQQMRDLVRDKLKAGESPDQIRAYFVSKYGEWILLEPKMTGLNIALYALPVVLIAGGLVLIAFLVRRWTKPAEAEEG